MIGRFWRGLSFELKSALMFAAGVLVLAAGFVSSLGLSGSESQGADAAADGPPLAETVTVERTLTVRGVRTVVKSVRVAPRAALTTMVLGTAVKVRTVTTPGRGIHVTVPGRASTIVETREGEVRTQVVTNDRVVTDRRVVTQQRTVTNDRTVTDVETREVTVPVTTVRTVTDTVTTTRVLTETAPPATVTVTVTCPPKGCG